MIRIFGWLMGSIWPILTLAQPSVFPADSAAHFARHITENLPAAKAYFIGQLHNNKANTLLEKELLFALNRQRGLRYDLLEYSHSAAFILNQYLDTGQDSLLALFHLKGAPFSFVRAVKAHNDAIPANRRIRFYGLDFEGRGGRLTQTGLRLLGQSLADTTSHLFSLLKAGWQASEKELPRHLSKMQAWLQKHPEEAQGALKDKYLDLWLIVNAQYGWSPRRDKPMYNNFRFLYQQLLEKDGVPPTFFGSFGTGHVNPGNTDGITVLMQAHKNSPARDSVIVLGAQYLDCHFFSDDNRMPSSGNLDLLCNEANTASLVKYIPTTGPALRFLAAKDIQQTPCGKRIKGLFGIVIIERFKATPYYFWE